MATPISDDLQGLVDLAKANPGIPATFNALLVMLGNAPDSSVIVAALGQLNAEAVPSDELREKAASLLEDADAPQLAALWSPASGAEAASNVVSLHRGPNGERVKIAGPKITFDDIGGLEDVKRQVRRKIINPFKDSGLFKKFKRKAGGGVLMYGPPGCGKTMMARALATECNAHFQNIRAADVLDQYVGNAEKRITGIFDEARKSKPVVLFFDEIEALAQRRQFDSNHSVSTVVSTLLNEMDGFSGENEGILFLGATNVPWSLDSAFRRPGRFDRTIFVPPPDKVARAFILKGLLEERPVAAGLSVDKIVKRSSGFSGADLEALVETATDYAIEESTSEEDLSPLNDDYFNEAFTEVRSSVGEWLGQAQNFAEYANKDGLYDDLAAFLKKYGR